MRTATAQAYSTNDTRLFIDCLIGPQQHDAHMKGYRWHQYVGDSEQRWEGVKAQLKKMIAERRAAENLLQAAE